MRAVVGRAKALALHEVTWDKYGGRILARVSADGVDVSALMLREGLAIPYKGEKKTNPWCAGQPENA